MQAATNCDWENVLNTMVMNGVEISSLLRKLRELQKKLEIWKRHVAKIPQEQLSSGRETVSIEMESHRRERQTVETYMNKIKNEIQRSKNEIDKMLKREGYRFSELPEKYWKV